MALSEKSESTIKKVATLLLAAGAPMLKLPYLLAQVCFETGYFKNEGAISFNNYSGIKYTNSGNQKHSHPSHDVHDSGAGGQYAIFDTPKDWAVDYLRILRRKTNPLDASTVVEFVSRLKMNGYFESSEDEYLSGLQSIISNHLDGLYPDKWNIPTLVRVGVAVVIKTA